MVTATPEFTKISENSNNDSYKSRLNSAVGIDEGQTKSDINDIHYYYSSGDFHFLFERGFKSETLEITKLTTVPFLPEWHAGIISIHGIIMPVIDILKFIKTQKINITANQQNKSYLLKLEHPEYRPIVFKLDTLPQTINTKELKKIRTAKDAPQWIKNYLKDDAVTLALIDHQKLFDQIVNAQ